jgi:Tol biopolymer transport system component
MHQLRQGTGIALAAAVVVGSALLVVAGAARAVPEATTNPAGTIVYTSLVGGKEQLFKMRPDGSARTQLTTGPTRSERGAMSPDGKWIAFGRIPADDSRAAIAMMRADGSDVRELTPRGFQTWPEFSPDGRMIVFTRDLSGSDNGIWVMRRDGTGMRRLTRNPFLKNGACGCDEHPKMSPDGQSVAFVRSKTSDQQQALFTIGIDGRGLRQILPYAPEISFIDWSPSGDRMAITRPGHPKAGESANVYTVRKDGRDLQPVTRFTGGASSALLGSYSPDGRWLVIRVQDSAADGIYIVQPDGRGLRRIASVDGGYLDWGRAR